MEFTNHTYLDIEDPMTGRVHAQTLVEADQLLSNEDPAQNEHTMMNQVRGERSDWRHEHLQLLHFLEINKVPEKDLRRYSTI